MFEVSWLGVINDALWYDNAASGSIPHLLHHDAAKGNSIRLFGLKSVAMVMVPPSLLILCLANQFQGHKVSQEESLLTEARFILSLASTCIVGMVCSFNQLGASSPPPPSKLVDVHSTI